MFCAYDIEENIIAFHDSKKVVQKYIDTIFSIHKVELKLGKIKKTSEWKISDKDDLYLVRFNDTYVQSGYLLYLELAEDSLIKDEETARDILSKIIEIGRVTDKETKKLEKAIKVIEDLLSEDRSYVPTLTQLKSMKLDYDPYIYNVGLCDL